MNQKPQDEARIGVGAVGIRDVESEGLPRQMAQQDGFELRAFCDEGCEQDGPAQRPVRYYSDYNMLLKDPEVEVVLVDGPVELRRDFAVRALNAGRHVVTNMPFAEDSFGGERIMKTALKKGLIATCDLKGRDDADFVAIRNAFSEANVSGLYAIEGFWSCTEQQLKRAGQQDLLEAFGFELLDQLHMLTEGEIKSVTTHLYSAREGGPVQHFFISIAMRKRGWATLQGAVDMPASLPRWRAFAAGMVLTATCGQVTIHDNEGARSLEGVVEPDDFWTNLYEAVRQGADLKCHPVDIVRAMKLQEAALESAEIGEPVTL